MVNFWENPVYWLVRIVREGVGEPDLYDMENL